MHTPTQQHPWYRQFWPWFIIALPLTAVIAGIATWIIAAQDPDGLVADDYYKQGLAINQTLDRERQAETLGLSGLLRVSGDAQRVELTLTGNFTPETPLVLRMIHPTRPNLDRTLNLHSTADGAWSTTLEKPAPGRWQLQLEPADAAWRLSGRLSLPTQLQAALQPNTH